MVCAMLRNEPNKEYLELEDQPEPKTQYTLILETHKKNKILKAIM